MASADTVYTKLEEHVLHNSILNYNIGCYKMKKIMEYDFNPIKEFKIKEDKTEDYQIWEHRKDKQKYFVFKCYINLNKKRVHKKYYNITKHRIDVLGLDLGCKGLMTANKFIKYNDNIYMSIPHQVPLFMFLRKASQSDDPLFSMERMALIIKQEVETILDAHRKLSGSGHFFILRSLTINNMFLEVTNGGIQLKLLIEDAIFTSNGGTFTVITETPNGHRYAGKDTRINGKYTKSQNVRVIMINAIEIIGVLFGRNIGAQNDTDFCKFIDENRWIEFIAGKKYNAIVEKGGIEKDIKWSTMTSFINKHMRLEQKDHNHSIEELAKDSFLAGLTVERMKKIENGFIEKLQQLLENKKNALSMVKREDLRRRMLKYGEKTMIGYNDKGESHLSFIQDFDRTPIDDIKTYFKGFPTFKNDDDDKKEDKDYPNKHGKKKKNKKSEKKKVSKQKLQYLVGFGFDKKKAFKALLNSKGNVATAGQLLCNDPTSFKRKNYYKK